MEIFNKQIFGSDVDAFLKLCKEKKIEWIKNNTNQQNDELINEFLLNPIIQKECQCLNCGKNGNISKNNVKENVDSSERNVVKKPSKRNSTKRQPNS